MNRDKHEAITIWSFVGVDLGQSRDFTALAVLERAPLGTPYPEIVERVRRTTRAPELAGRGGGEPEQRILQRAEAGPDYGLAGVAATRGVADSGGIEVRAGPGDGADGDAGEGGLRGAGAIRGVAGRDARRPGVRGGAGVLGGAEDLPEGRDGGGEGRNGHG